MLIHYEEQYELLGKLESIACLKMLYDRNIDFGNLSPITNINLTGAAEWLYNTIQFLFPSAVYGELYDEDDNFISTLQSTIKISNEYVIFIEDERLTPYLRSKPINHMLLLGTQDAEIRKIDDNSFIIAFDFHFGLMELFERVIQIYDLIGGNPDGCVNKTD